MLQKEHKKSFIDNLFKGSGVFTESEANQFDCLIVDEAHRLNAKSIGAKLVEMKLDSQFRCNGSDGYLAWIDDVLNIRSTANADSYDFEYDIQIFDDPNQMRDEIYHPCIKDR